MKRGNSDKPPLNVREGDDGWDIADCPECGSQVNQGVDEDADGNLRWDMMWNCTGCDYRYEEPDDDSGE
jgi:rubredoxin